MSAAATSCCMVRKLKPVSFECWAAISKHAC
ncbi:Uncharacterised protein [Vibrio cholerae]|nr:Uncharacterised protein [Vibrio cholerae]